MLGPWAEAKWYIVHAYSNFEKKVAQAIRDQAAMKGLEDFIEDLEVPTEEVVEVVRGKKKTIEKRYFPGYVLMKAKLTDDVYHLVKDTPKVTGFLGADGGKKPLPVPQREVDRILGTADERDETERSSKANRRLRDWPGSPRSTKALSKASKAQSKSSTQRQAA